MLGDMGTCAENKTLSCGIMVNLLLREAKSSFDISSPSMTIRPASASTNRKKLRANVLFPLPVRPQMPILIGAVPTAVDE
jgi:hypothetical protein